MKKQWVTFFQKNTGWIISIFTSFAIIVTFILKLIKYTYSRIYFNYFGINYSFFNVNELDFLYTFSFSILYIILLFSIFHLFLEVFEVFRGGLLKKEYKKVAFDIAIIVFSNALCAFPIASKFMFKTYVVKIIEFMLIEFFISYLFFRKEKKSSHVINSIKDEIAYLIKLLFVYFCFMFASCFALYGYELKHIKSYNIIEDNKVIVYSTNDYYVALNCKISGDELIIYKGEQTKLDNNNVNSKIIEFDKVTIK